MCPSRLPSTDGGPRVPLLLMQFSDMPPQQPTGQHGCHTAHHFIIYLKDLTATPLCCLACPRHLGDSTQVAPRRMLRHTLPCTLRQSHLVLKRRAVVLYLLKRELRWRPAQSTATRRPNKPSKNSCELGITQGIGLADTAR
mmetsp:Transcript_24431/g.78506  ORF Transcript_24431/g.78506 Transcript_24431/m.78506 type:complete len:141 (+) Transcript_24431:120-542(+)